MAEKEKFIYEKSWHSTYPGRGVKWKRWHGWKARAYNPTNNKEVAPAHSIWRNVWQVSEYRFGNSDSQRDLWGKCKRKLTQCMGSTSWRLVTYDDETGRLMYDVPSSRWPRYN